MVIQTGMVAAIHHGGLVNPEHVCVISHCVNYKRSCTYMHSLLPCTGNHDVGVIVTMR